MSRIAKAFQNGKAFIPFVTGGDPDLETSEKLLAAMQEAGADMIEIGVPFSDPIAEGAVIQEANERALAAGCTTDKLFDMVAHAREKVSIPLVFLTYANPIYAYGKRRFMERCKQAGIDGIIVPDLPYEERDEMAADCEAFGIDMIPIITPTSKERITMIAKEAAGFIYCVSSLGVTGVRKEIQTDVRNMVAYVRKASNAPVAVGFGISTPEQAVSMASVSDGAIVGSAIVKLIAQHGRQSIEPVAAYVGMMKEALKEIKN
ncbi:MAG: tryptophan synthase subunit alpha [Lachnospiraceae bacterium]|nr:tryptophan synthase subunit alpha [Lachnospiraceae bacterium]